MQDLVNSSEGLKVVFKNLDQDMRKFIHVFLVYVLILQTIIGKSRLKFKLSLNSIIKLSHWLFVPGS